MLDIPDRIVTDLLSTREACDEAEYRSPLEQPRVDPCRHKPARRTITAASRYLPGQAQQSEGSPRTRNFAFLREKGYPGWHSVLLSRPRGSSHKSNPGRSRQGTST